MTDSDRGRDSDRVVRCSIVDGIATITLDSPSNRNALSRPLVRDLNLALDEAERDDVRVIVLTHTGNTFCAGADLKERIAGPVDSTPIVRILARLMESQRPTIAALKGLARAGGTGLMAACDLVVVPPTSDFAFTEVRLGAAPAMISVPLLRRCSVVHLRPLFLTGDTFDAAHANRVGLVDQVADDVDSCVATWCSSLLRAGPNALAATKEILLTVPGEPIGAALVRMQRLSESLFESAEAAEGMQALFAKRAPSWAPATPATGSPTREP